MVSNTQQTRRIRRNRRKNSGKNRKRLMAKKGTPIIPVHPEGYDPKAADAKTSSKGDS